MSDSMSTRPATPASAHGGRVSEGRLRLDFLDGLRGLMALYVVLFHAIYWARELPLHPVIYVTTYWLRFGHFAVDVFIVLSGFCLMMPVVRAQTGTLPNGFVNYIRRRARRIIPPYYAAFCFSIILVLTGQFLQRSGTVGGTKVNDILSPGIIISHLLLVHNLDFVWAHRINSPMWSVATEWQIYFLFPLLLLPLQRRSGHVVTIVVAVLLGLLPWFFLPEDRNLYWAYPWFLGLFAMGMAAADYSLRPGAFTNRWHLLIAQWPVAVCAFVLVLFPILPSHTPIWVHDILIGIGTMSLVMYCTRCLTRQRTGQSPFLLRVFESRWATRLGAFSYSLYLIHNPIQQASIRVLQTFVSSTEIILGIVLAFSLTVIVAVAYLFHYVFERPFLNMPPKATERASSPGALIWVTNRILR